MVAGRGERVLRALFVSAAAVSFGAISHALGGGHLPSWLALAAALVFVTPLVTLFSGKPASIWRVVAAVLVAQGLFHTFFALLEAPTAALATHQTHHSSAGGASLAAIGTEVAHLAPSALMLTSHAIAAALTMVVLVFADRALTQLRALAACLLTWIRAAVTPVAAAHLASLQKLPAMLEASMGYVGQRLTETTSLRGPPRPASSF